MHQRAKWVLNAIDWRMMKCNAEQNCDRNAVHKVTKRIVTENHTRYDVPKPRSKRIP